jgi:hypothetical protein
MSAGRWLRGLPAVGLVLIWAVLSAGPAAAAPCTGPNCYQYRTDLTVRALSSPIPVPPGGLLRITAWLTNDGWRIGAGGSRVPWPGPATGEVHMVALPESGHEVPVGVDAPGFTCGLWGGLGGAAHECVIPSVPAGATLPLTFDFRAPHAHGTYVVRVWAVPYGWTDYDDHNHHLTLTYRVGYLA